MVLYSIHWERDPDFPRKEFTTEQKEWYFCKKLGYRGSLRITDVSLKCRRSKIDSRNFDATYLMLDGMKEPFDCIDAKSNYLRLNKMF